MQEPFTPNRADADVEPSISQTQTFVSRGAVGLCNSKLVAGSSMNYSTALGSVNIRGKKIVIEAANDVTRISMLEGESTVRGGANDQGGLTLKVGEQALIRRGVGGMPNTVRIQAIPQDELPKLDDKVAMACMAKKTVYFEVRERTVDVTSRAAIEVAAAETAPAAPDAAKSTETAAGSSTENAAGASTANSAGGATNAPTGGTTSAGSAAAGGSNQPTGSTAFTPINAFTPVPTPGTPGGTVVIREIVPVVILPVTLPVEFTVSTAKIN